MQYNAVMCVKGVSYLKIKIHLSLAKDGEEIYYGTTILERKLDTPVTDALLWESIRDAIHYIGAEREANTYTVDYYTIDE